MNRMDRLLVSLYEMIEDNNLVYAIFVEPYNGCTLHICKTMDGQCETIEETYDTEEECSERIDEIMSKQSRKDIPIIRFTKAGDTRS